MIDYSERCGHDCDDQIPIISVVGRGPKGDSVDAYTEIRNDTEVWLIITTKDNVSGEVHTEEQRVDGGLLTYQIKRYPSSTPPVFTITFTYRRANENGADPLWKFETPGIPYDPSTISGSTELSLDDLAVILGFSPESLQDLLDAGVVPTEDIDGDTIKDYVDSADADILSHIHGDMGFGTILVNDGDTDTQTPKRNTIKKWFDWLLSKLGFGDTFGSLAPATSVKGYIDGVAAAMDAKWEQAFNDLFDKIYGEAGASIDSTTGEITWTKTQKIPLGDLNIFSGNSDPASTDFDDAIRSRALSDNDLKAE